MSFLITLSSFFKKQINFTYKEKIESCKEYPDLYADDDFLEISRMSSKELRSEIYTYNKDPDEILALIKGRLDNKITPINKVNEPLYAINFSTFLSNVIDKKIYLDAFNKQQKNNNLSIPLYSILMVSIITFLFIPPVIETKKYISAKNESNNAIKNNNANEAIASLKTKDKNYLLLEEHNNLKEEYRKLSEKYKAVLAEKRAYKTYTTMQGLDENPLQKTSSRDNSTIASSLKATMINFDSDGGLLDGEKISNLSTKTTKIRVNENKGLLSSSELKMVNYNDSLPVGKPSISSKEISVKLKEGYSLSYVARMYNLSIANWGGFGELSSMEEGASLVMEPDGNYVTKISYIEKDGSVINYRVCKDTITSTSGRLYYTEDLLIEGKIITSLSEAIKNNKDIKNNIQIARVITYKVENYLATEPKVNFKRIAYEAPFVIVVKVRKNIKTHEIMYVEDVKVNKLGTLDIASNT